MTHDSTGSQTVRNPLLKHLIAGVFLINLLAGSIVWVSLQNSKIRYDEEATVNAENISNILNENISNIYEKVDLSLQAVCDEASRQLAGGSIQKDELDPFIIRLHSRLPELISFRATDTSGDAIYGLTTKAATTTSLAHRDYFTFHRNNPNSGMVSSEPLIGGISGKWMIILSRRIDGPDGAFAGLVYAGLGLDYLSQSFKELNVGANGSITLLDRNLSIVVRFPDPASTGKQIDRKMVFPALIEQIQRNNISRTFTAISPVDDIERIFSYRILSHHLKYYIVTGLSPLDYLAGWRSELFKMSLFAAGFCISTIIFAWLLHLGWMKIRMSEIASEQSLRALNESLEERVLERTQSAENANRILQAVINCMSDWVWEIDTEKRYAYCSPQVEISMGYTPDEMIGKTLFEFMADDEAKQVRCVFEDVFLEQSLIRGLEHHCIAKDGRTVLFITNAVPILDINGKLKGYRGVETDLTAHRNAENSVRQQREFLEILVDTIPNPVFYKDIDGRYTGCNKAFEVFSGRHRQEIIGKTVYDIGPKELADKYYQKDRELFDQPGQQQYEWLVQGKDGNLRNVIFDKATIQDKDGCVEGLIGVISDITERKQAEAERLQLEQQLQQAQKAESLSTMAGAIAHNFNNILAAVIGNLEMAADEAPQGSDLQIFIDEALSSSLRAAELTRIMLTYLGYTDGKDKPVDVADAVKEAMSMLAPSIQRNIHLNTAVSPHGLIVTTDRDHLVQILSNVLFNAVEAIGEQKGEITLTIDVLPQSTIQDDTFFPPGWKPKQEAYVCITIADTGPGIDRENLEKIFDPFFSTKFLGRGLGLSMVAGLIRSMDGGISVTSKPGRGSSFSLYFPMMEHTHEK
jgi:PAS domain S-box-containing protein